MLGSGALYGKTRSGWAHSLALRGGGMDLDWPFLSTNAHRLTRAVGGWEGMLIPMKQERLEVGSSQIA